MFFTSRSGEENVDRAPYAIEVLDDLAPQVVLTKPGQDVALPLGGTLPIEGMAHDDIGIRSTIDLRDEMRAEKDEAMPAGVDRLSK